MSMEHKAYLFDCDLFVEKIRGIMEDTVHDPKVAKEYIRQYPDRFCSPYTGEPLQGDWEEELSSNTLQEYFDFLLTACYDVNADKGLGYLWDGVHEGIVEMKIFDNPDKIVFGDELTIKNILVNPGGMGLGIIEASQVAQIYEKLRSNREMLNSIDLDMDNFLYEAEPEDILDGYDDLCNIYGEALKQGKGIMFTF